MVPGGTPPDPSLILPGVAYDSNAQKVYLFGGKNHLKTRSLQDSQEFTRQIGQWSGANHYFRHRGNSQLGQTTER